MTIIPFIKKRYSSNVAGFVQIQSDVHRQSNPRVNRRRQHRHVIMQVLVLIHGCTIQCKRVLQCARAGGSHTAHYTDGTQVGGTYLWVSTWPPYFIRRSWLRSFDRLFDTSPVLAILSLSQCASSPSGPVAGWPFTTYYSKVRLNTPPPIVAFLAFQTLRPSEFFLPAVVSGHLICSSLYMCRMLQYGIVQVQTTSF